MRKAPAPRRRASSLNSDQAIDSLSGPFMGRDAGGRQLRGSPEAASRPGHVPVGRADELR